MLSNSRWEWSNLGYGVAMDLLGGWALMMLIGVVYGEFGLLQPIGYWVSTFMVFLFGWCVTAFITPVYRHQRRQLEYLDRIANR